MREEELFTPKQRHWDYTTYPPEIQGIVKILFEYESDLSDGFGYYGDVRRTLTALACEILTLDKKVEEVESDV